MWNSLQEEVRAQYTLRKCMEYRPTYIIPYAKFLNNIILRKKNNFTNINKNYIGFIVHKAGGEGSQA